MGGKKYQSSLNRVVHSSIDLGFEYRCTNRSLERNALKLMEKAERDYGKTGDAKELFAFTCQAFEALGEVSEDMDQGYARALGKRLVELWTLAYESTFGEIDSLEMLEGILDLLKEEHPALFKEAYVFLRGHFGKPQELQKKAAFFQEKLETLGEKGDLGPSPRRRELMAQRLWVMHQQGLSLETLQSDASFLEGLSWEEALAELEREEAEALGEDGKAKWSCLTREKGTKNKSILLAETLDEC